MNAGRRFALRVTILTFCAAIEAQTIDLDRFVGKDLSIRRLSKSDARRLNELIGKVPKGHMMEPLPWHVWRTSRTGKTRYVVLLVESEVLVPGGSSACVLLFDAAGTTINRWCFSTGWRITPVAASLQYSRELDSELLRLDVIRFVNGRNVAKEYFAISNDQLRFVRMENDKGEAVQNEYVQGSAEIGFVPTASTIDEWASMLESEDKSNVLSTLVFLSGRHTDDPIWRGTPGPHESRYAKLAQRLLGSSRIKELITSLTHSGDPWIRDAALLAARGPSTEMFP